MAISPAPRGSGGGRDIDAKRLLKFVIGLMIALILITGVYIHNVALGGNIHHSGSSVHSGGGGGLVPWFQGTNTEPVVETPEPIPETEEPTPEPTTAAPTRKPPPEVMLSDELVRKLKENSWADRVWNAVRKAAENPDAQDVVPVMVIPLFHDGPELDGLLQSIDAPVRLFAFGWNSDDSDVLHRMNLLRQLPYGVAVMHHPENIGFSGAVNEGIRAGERNAAELNIDIKNDWYFIVNADAAFPRNALGDFAAQVNRDKLDHGLFYGPRQDHFAFALTRLAVVTVGYFDEVFFPGYMEDIDYHWRVRIAGLNKKITGVQFIHRGGGSTGLKKPNNQKYVNMLTRSSRGWEYGWMKWGKYHSGHIEADHPPSRWTTPFNIPGAPLSLWAIDPGQRACVRTSKGHYHIQSSTCWYNGTVLLEKLPNGTKLTDNLLRPGPSGG